MKAKKINRKNLIDLIKKLTKTKEKLQFGLYHFYDDNNEHLFQLEFIPQTKKYFFTIYFVGVSSLPVSIKIHNEITNYLKGLNLGRNIILHTDKLNTLI